MNRLGYEESLPLTREGFLPLRRKRSFALKNNRRTLRRAESPLDCSLFSRPRRSRQTPCHFVTFSSPETAHPLSLRDIPLTGGPHRGALYTREPFLLSPCIIPNSNSFLNIFNNSTSFHIDIYKKPRSFL